MSQLQLPLEPREKGRTAGERCIAKAERVADPDFGRKAREFFIGWLDRNAISSGEIMVNAAKQIAGLIPHDDRSFGPVFAKLVRDGAIERAPGEVPRMKGRGTSGGRLWRKARRG